MDIIIELRIIIILITDYILVFRNNVLYFRKYNLQFLIVSFICGLRECSGFLLHFSVSLLNVVCISANNCRLQLWRDENWMLRTMPRTTS